MPYPVLAGSAFLEQSTLNPTAHIFEPFYTTKPPGAGSGLGMAMVYGLAEQHGGAVDVASEPGSGTTVSIYFPTADQRVQAATTSEPKPTVRRGTETILLVEDEDALRRVGRRVLEKFGHTVLLASNGEEALELYGEHRESIDMIFSDLVMPRMGGRKLYETLQDRFSGIKFLFATGYADKELKERDALDPSIPVLQKPWTVEELLQSVRGVLDETAVV